MTSTSTRMICPNCGFEMNHHGDKLVYAADPQDIAQFDPATGGIVEEFHTCPRCGTSASRHA